MQIWLLFVIWANLKSLCEVKFVWVLLRMCTIVSMFLLKCKLVHKDQENDNTLPHSVACKQKKHPRHVPTNISHGKALDAAKDDIPLAFSWYVITYHFSPV